MLAKIFQSIPRKSYNNFGNVVILLLFLCGVIIVPIANDFDAKTNIRCSPVSKGISSSGDFVQLTCSSKYEAKYHWKISFGVLVLFNFALVLAFSVFYASWANSRVEKWDISTNKENRDEGTAEIKNDISLLYIYVFHLLFTRFFLLLLFAFTIFYPMNFPTNFSCPWRSPPNIIPCVNIMAAKKITLAKTIAMIDVVFALLALAEVIYIFRWKRSDEEFCLIEDMEFCSVYILQRRENIGSIIRKIRNSQKAHTNFFIKLIIQENKSNERHEIYDVHLDKPHQQIDKIEDIFKPTNTGNIVPRRILIVGRPGIGKTVLTNQILQEWKKQNVIFWKGKLVIRLAFRTFNHDKNKKLNLFTLFSYGDGVTPTASKQKFEDLYKFINLNQDKVIIVFDGLDELDVDLENCWQEEGSTQNSAELNMSVFSLYVKLIRGKFLPEATIITTTRRTAEELYQSLDIFFDKKLEILGFTEFEIENYVVKFCKRNQELRTQLWDTIKRSAELLSICYIPVSCKIVCSTLKESIAFQNQWGRVSLTMTEIYRRYVTIMLHEHHKLFKTKRKKKGYIFEAKLPRELELDLIRLEKIAKFELDQQTLEFLLGEDFVNLENCGLLVKIEDEFRDLYSFPHLTIQEYLAARHIFHDVDNISDFLARKIKEPRWHLVIQFLAGLIGNEIRKSQNDDTIPENTSSPPTPSTATTENALRKLKNIVYDSFMQWSTRLALESNVENGRIKRVALLGVKCLNEIQDHNITKNAASMLDIAGNGCLNLSGLDITPVDCKALFDFLIQKKDLKELDISRNKITDHAVLELCKFLRNSSLGKLDISHNFVTDKGLEMFGDALSEEKCRLHSFEIGWSRGATLNGYNKLSDTLKEAGFDGFEMAMTGSPRRGNIVSFSMCKRLQVIEHIPEVEKVG